MIVKRRRSRLLFFESGIEMSHLCCTFSWNVKLILRLALRAHISFECQSFLAVRRSILLVTIELIFLNHSLRNSNFNTAESEKHQSMASKSIPSISSLGSGSFSEDSLDDVLAQKSALVYLCQMNADYREIERFLASFPEALLFESDDSKLEDFVARQMKECKCFGFSCNLNRRCILRALRRGFEFYRGVRLDNVGFDNKQKNLEAYIPHLKQIENEIRILKSNEAEIETQVARAMNGVANLRGQIEKVSKKRNQHGHMNPLHKLKCRKVHADEFEERAELETKLAATSVSIAALEKEQYLLRTEVATASRLQHALLKQCFSDCKRHMCNASGVDA